MSWHIKGKQSEVLPVVHRTDGSNTGAECSAQSRTYPDHWWGDEWWAQLKLAGRYEHILGRISLPAPPDAETSDREAKEVLSHRSAPDYGARLSEIFEENEGPPAYYHRMLLTDQGRNSQTGALIGSTISWSLPPIMHFKHKWKRARPMQLEPHIRPAVDCPTHPAYPSGHSTQSHLIALVIGEITGRDDIRKSLWAAADRIAENREYAGLHYRSDSLCGVHLAEQLFPFFVKEHQVLINKTRSDEWT